jgi:hypothetical protein
MQGEQLHWWQTRLFVALLALASTIPLLWPDIPPLVDLPGHLGRYRVQMAIDGAPHLREWYAFRWALIGNLGIDLLVVPLERLVGLELAVKLIVITIPALTVAGLLWIAREVHGRVPATALFALPLAYSYPFQFGFANYALSMAIALNLFALWLRLARQGRFALRAWLFVPLSCLLWLCHTFGWGALGVLAFSAEMIRQHDRLKEGHHGHWVASWVRAGLGCLPLALPIAFMVFWRSGDHVTGQTADWFNWQAKINWIAMMLRDRWQAFDLLSVLLLFGVLVVGLLHRGLEYSRHLSVSAAFLAAVFVVLPRIVFGSAYADMRLAPFVLAIAVIAIRPRPGMSWRGATIFAGLGLLFFGARLAGTTASYWLYDQRYDRALAALDVVPQGARVLTLVGRRCEDDWTYSRLEHLPAMLLVRRLAFSNDQWSMPGAQQLTVRPGPARGWSHDPSQIVTDRQCRGEWWRPIRRSLARLPRGAFDYLWLLQPPPYEKSLVRGMTPVWRNGDDVLYRIDQPRRNGVSSPR